MAIVQNPIINRASGRVGSDVFSKWKKHNILKSAPTTPYPPPSSAQQDQRYKFSYLIAFWNQFSELKDFIFINKKTLNTSFSAFMHRNLWLMVSYSEKPLESMVPLMVFSEGELTKLRVTLFEVISNYFNLTVTPILPFSSFDISDYYGLIWIYNYTTNVLTAFWTEAPYAFEYISVPLDNSPGNHFFIFCSYYNALTVKSSKSIYCGEAIF